MASSSAPKQSNAATDISAETLQQALTMPLELRWKIWSSCEEVGNLLQNEGLAREFVEGLFPPKTSTSINRTVLGKIELTILPNYGDEIGNWIGVCIERNFGDRMFCLKWFVKWLDEPMLQRLRQAVQLVMSVEVVVPAETVEGLQNNVSAALCFLAQAHDLVRLVKTLPKVLRVKFNWTSGRVPVRPGLIEDQLIPAAIAHGMALPQNPDWLFRPLDQFETIHFDRWATKEAREAYKLLPQLLALLPARAPQPFPAGSDDNNALQPATAPMSIADSLRRRAALLQGSLMSTNNLTNTEDEYLEAELEFERRCRDGRIILTDLR